MTKIEAAEIILKSGSKWFVCRACNGRGFQKSSRLFVKCARCKGAKLTLPLKVRQAYANLKIEPPLPPVLGRISDT